MIFSGPWPTCARTRCTTRATTTHACGLGFVVRVSGEADHSIVEMGLEVLRKMEHRGATGADPETGDGAGILLQLPDGFLRRWAREELDAELPAARRVRASAMVLPAARPGAAAALRGAARAHLRRGGAARRSAGATCPSTRRASARWRAQSEPVMRQLFVGTRPRRRRRRVRAQAVRDPPARRAGRRRAAGVREADVLDRRASRTRRSIYKGLLRASPARPLLPRPAAIRASSRALALVHSRFSTNTLGTWDLAQPFNLPRPQRRDQHRARQPLAGCTRASRSCARRCSATTSQKLFPIIEERWSDSAKLDAALELLVMAGRSLAHAADDAGPAAWTDPRRDAGRRPRVLRVPRRAGRAVGRPGGDRRHATAGRSAPRSTATACGRRATRCTRDGLRRARLRGRRARPRPRRRDRRADRARARAGMLLVDTVAGPHRSATTS